MLASEVSGYRKEGGRIRAWHQLAQTENPKLSPPAFMSLMDAPTTVLHMEHTISDPSARPKWDSFCKSGRSVHTYNAQCEQIEMIFKPMWPIKSRDQHIVTARRWALCCAFTARERSDPDPRAG